MSSSCSSCREPEEEMRFATAWTDLDLWGSVCLNSCHPENFSRAKSIGRKYERTGGFYRISFPIYQVAIFSVNTQVDLKEIEMEIGAVGSLKW